MALACVAGAAVGAHLTGLTGNAPAAATTPSGERGHRLVENRPRPGRGGPAGLFATEAGGERRLLRRDAGTRAWLPTGRAALGFAVGSSLYGVSRTDFRVHRWHGFGGEDDWTALGSAGFDSVHAGGAGVWVRIGKPGAGLAASP